MFCLCDTARVLAFENSLNSARKFHIDFANNFFVFDYIYTDAWINKAEHRIINIDDIIDFDDIFFSLISFSSFCFNCFVVSSNTSSSL